MSMAHLDLLHTAHYLLLAIFWAGDEIYGLHVSHVDLIAKNVCEYNLGDISWNQCMLALDQRSHQTA